MEESPDGVVCRIGFNLLFAKVMGMEAAAYRAWEMSVWKVMETLT